MGPVNVSSVNDISVKMLGNDHQLKFVHTYPANGVFGQVMSNPHVGLYSYVGNKT